MSNTESKERLTKGALISYGGFALPLAITDIPIIMYLPAFYATEVGLSIGMVGLVLLLARLWDGCSDPIVGTLSDRTGSRYGRRKPWVIGGTPLLMVATWFLCNPPEQVGLLYLGFWAVLFYTAKTIVTIPYWSWGAELSSVYEERSRITGFRETGSMFGNIIVAAAPVLVLANNTPTRDVLWLITGMVIILIPLAIAPLAIAVKDPQRLPDSSIQFSQFFMVMRQNRPLQLFLIAVVCNSVSLGVINSTAIFLVDTGFGLPGAFFSIILIQYIAAIVSVPLLIRVGRRYSKHQMLACSFAVSCLYYLILSVLPMGNYFVIAGFVCISGVTFACAYIFASSVLADVVDYDTASSGEERTGVHMALYTLIWKVGLALGVGLAYGLLDIVGFDPAATHSTAGDVLKIRLIACIPTSLLLIPAAIILWNFPITKKVQKELRQKIDARANPSQHDSDNTPTQSSTIPALSDNV